MSDPELIRSGSPHEVSVSQGSKVAGGKKVGAAEPSVRNTLAGEDPAPLAPPEPEFHAPARIAAAAEAEAVYDQRSIQVDVRGAQGDLPASQAAPAGALADAPVIERSQQDTVAQLPASVSAPPSAPDGEAAPLLARDLSDTLVTLPPENSEPQVATQAPDALRREDDVLVAVPQAPADETNRAQLPESAPAQPADEGPLVTRSQTDTLVAVPESAAAKPPASGPLITRDESQSMADVPELAAGVKSDPEMPPPVAGRRTHEVPQIAEAAFRPAAELVEIEEIAEIVEIAELAPQALQVAPAPAESALEPVPEQVMAQMNFPARVVKLKIANDKVRTQLDALEAPERPGR